MEKEHITKGKAKKQYVSGVCIGVGIEIQKNYSLMICNSLLPETDAEYEKQKPNIEADMSLIKEAFNVFNETGYTPMELLNKIKQLTMSIP